MVSQGHAAIGRRALWGTMALLSVVIALFSYRYLLSVGPLPPGIMQNLFARPWLVAHVASAATALLVGSVQFLPVTRRTRLHRVLGRIYVAGCGAGAVSGLVLAAGSTAGPVATLGFGALAIVWMATTTLGWRAATQRRFEAHRAWMIRSFALTFAAVTLRIYLPLSMLLPVDGLDAYRAISFACWIPNLALAELYLRRTSYAPMSLAARGAK